MQSKKDYDWGKAASWERRIFAFWTGDNPMTRNRIESLGTFERTDLFLVLITPENLSDWVVPGHPIHAAYRHLSFIQRGDYLKAYFMFHHGGGFADIKRQTGSWRNAVGRVLSNRRLMGAGYREIKGGTPFLQNNRVNGQSYLLSKPVPAPVAALVTNAMRGFYPLMIGNGAGYFKPGSLYTRLWLQAVENRLDLLLPYMKNRTTSSPREHVEDGYPVPWSFLHGDVGSPLSLAFSWALSRDIPRPSFENYI